MKLKRLSLFLALVMILSAFAGTFAVNAEGEGPWMVGENHYATIGAAVAAATNGETVYLTEDCEVTGGVEAIAPAKDMVIDLQGHSVTKGGTGGRWINIDASVAAGTDVTIRDGKITSHYQGSIAQINAVGVTLTFEDVELISKDGTTDNAVLIVNGADSTLNLNNVKMTVAANTKYIIWDNVAGATINVNGLTFFGSASVTAHFIYLANADSTVNLMGDMEFTRLTASHCIVFVNSGGVVTIGDKTGAVATTLKSANNTRVVATQNTHPNTGAVLTTSKVVYNAYNATISSYAGDSIFQHTTSTADSSITIENCDISNFGGKIIRGDANVAGATFTITNSKLATTTVPAILATNATVTMTNTSVAFDTAGQTVVDTATTDTTAPNALYINGTIANAPELNATDAASIDAYAKFMGFNFRTSDAVTAYASGAFSGYTVNWAKALTTVAADGTITMIDDALWGSNTVPTVAFTADLNGKTLSTLGAPARLMNNINTAITVKNGNIVCNAGNSSLIQFLSGATSGAHLTLTDIDIHAKTGTGTTSMIQMLGAGQSVKFTGDINVVADSPVHAIVQPYGQAQTVTFDKANATVVGYSRVIGMNATSHNTAVSSTIAAVTVAITDSVINTNAWDGMFQSYATAATITIDNSDIILPSNKYFLRISNAGATATVNNGTLTAAAAESYFMPTGSIENGASIRVARSTDVNNELANSGIRFESTISAAINTHVEELMESGAITGAKVGTVIFKYDDLGTKTVAELVNDANADAEDDLKVADIPCINGFTENADGSVSVRAALVNIKTTNYNVDFGAVAYIEYTLKDGETVRIYGTFNATNNVRSIAAVAQAALADTKAEAGVVDGYNYYNEIEEGVFSCYSDEQIAILEAYAAARQD